MIDRRIALLVGALVLGGVLAVAWWLVSSGGARVPAVGGAPESVPTAEPLSASAGRAGDVAPAVAAGTAAAAPQSPEPRQRVRGVVLLPDGQAAAGASVTLYRKVSAWPEWRKVFLDQVVTGKTGEFSFEADRSPDLLIAYEHSGHANGLCEAPAAMPRLQLRLQPGFTVEGVVSNDFGKPVPNARVALESMFVDDRSARTAETNSSGRFTFEKVALGAVRIVARHEIWQPVVLSNVVVGGDNNLELHFERPALSVEGRVIAAATQEPIGGAVVLGLSPGQEMGRNDPATAVTGGDGRFRLAGLSPGSLRLEVRHEQFATATRSIVVGPSPSPLAIDLAVRTHVHGRLAGSARADGAILSLRSAANELVTATVRDGAFDFAASVTPGPATLAVADGRFAFAAGSSALQVRIDEVAQATLDLEVGPAAVVTGAVVDTAGAPIAGAQVSVRAVERVRQALFDTDLLRVPDLFARTASGGNSQLLAVTADDGSYRISGLTPGPVELRVSCAGYGGRRLGLEVPPPGASFAAPRLELQRGGRIEGHVRRGGQPLAGVQVEVVADGASVTAVSDLDGHYELVDLPAGELRVRARYSTMPLVVAKDPAVVEPLRPATVDLDLPAGRIVRGQVIGSEGQAVEGALVRIRGEPGNPVPTDSGGRFALEAPGGSIELQVMYGDSRARQDVKVVGTDDITVQIDAPPNCPVSGTVLGLPGRRQLPGVLMRIVREGEDLLSARSYWIELHGSSFRYPWFPTGAWQVTFCSEGHAPVVRQVQLQKGDDYYSFGELLLEPGCELRALVLGDGDRPLAGAEAFLGCESDLDVFQTQLRTGADGRIAVRGVASLAASLIVRAPGYAWQCVPLHLPDDVLASEPLKVRMQRGSTIEVDARAHAPEGTVMALRRGGRVLRTAEVDNDGKVQFQNCGPGDYVVQRFGDEQGQVAVRVDRSGEVVSVPF